MLKWLFPDSCPCDPAAKAWIEKRLAWMEQEFDDHAFNGRPLVLPVPESFPDPYDGSERAVHAIVRRVCGYMDVDPEELEIKFLADNTRVWLVNDSGQYLPQAAGLYQETAKSFVISICRSELLDPMGLVGTIAHELAHVRLLGERRLRGHEYDNELTTDLTTVFFGLGIFLANLPRNWDSQYRKWPGTGLNKPEYMTPPMFGYALAHLAWFRGEQEPAWAQHLKGDSKVYFKQSVRFLFKTHDSTFKPRKYRSRS